jgi:hypothetical protein
MVAAIRARKSVSLGQCRFPVALHHGKQGPTDRQTER